MSIRVKTAKFADELAGEIAVGEILASWSIEEIGQLIKEIEAEIRCRTPAGGALRSRRATPSRRPRLTH
jgi:hypothetical protein